VEIVFEFERVRNFSAVRFHANNMFSKDVRVFRRAVLRFSVSGRRYSDPTTVVFDYMRDTLIEFARNVIIAVPNHVARFVNAQLYFDARWLMISEVRFESGTFTFAFSALTLLVGRQEGHPACKKLSGGVLAWLSIWSEVQTCIWPS